MGIAYADLRLANDARDDLEEINANAVVDMGALHQPFQGVLFAANSSLAVET